MHKRSHIQPLHAYTPSTWQHTFHCDLQTKTVFNSSGKVVQTWSRHETLFSLQKSWQSARGPGHFHYNRQLRRFGVCCSHQAAAISSAALSRSCSVIRNREDGGKSSRLTFTSPCFIRSEFPLLFGQHTSALMSYLPQVLLNIDTGRNSSHGSCRML